VGAEKKPRDTAPEAPKEAGAATRKESLTGDYKEAKKAAVLRKTNLPR